MGCYYTLRYNTYAFSLLFYKVYMKRENAGSWNSGPKKEQVWDTYFAQLEKPRKSMRNYFGFYKKYWAEEVQEGSHQEATSLPGATRGAPGGLVGSQLHPSGWFWRQYFLYIPQKIPVNFQVIPRTFISAQKQHHGNSAENSISPGYFHSNHAN